MYRQGDVLLVPVDGIPTDAVKRPRRKGRLILAQGEVTGHHHSLVAERGCEIDVLETKAGEVFARIMGDDLKRHDPSTPVRCVQCGDKVVTLATAIAAGAKGHLLVHQEHTAEVIEPGNYEAVIQREYTPQEIRRVAD